MADPIPLHIGDVQWTVSGKPFGLHRTRASWFIIGYIRQLVREYTCDQSGKPLAAKPKGWSFDDIEPLAMEMIIDTCLSFLVGTDRVIDRYAREAFSDSHMVGWEAAGEQYARARNGDGGFTAELGDLAGALNSLAEQRGPQYLRLTGDTFDVLPGRVYGLKWAGRR